MVKKWGEISKIINKIGKDRNFHSQYWHCIRPWCLYSRAYVRPLRPYELISYCWYYYT